MAGKISSETGPVGFVPIWLYDLGVSATSIALFALMWGKWTDKNGGCWPSRSTLASELKVSVKTIDRCLEELIECGAISKIGRANPKGDQTSNHYHLYLSIPIEVPCVRTKDETLGKSGAWEAKMKARRGGDMGDATPRGGDMGDATPVHQCRHRGCMGVATPGTPVSPEPDPYEPDSLNTDSVNLPPSSPPTDSTRKDFVQDDLSTPPVGPESSDHSTNPLPPEAAAPPSPKSSDSDGGDPDRSISADPEVVRLCELLADLIHANGNTRPNPNTKQWYTACRLLMTKDGPDGDGWSPERIETIIRWSQANEFWQSNILSMPKLRKQFDQLRMRRNAELTKTTETSGGTFHDRLAAAAEKIKEKRNVERS